MLIYTSIIWEYLEMCSLAICTLRFPRCDDRELKLRHAIGPYGMELKQ